MSLLDKIKSTCADISPNCREAVRAQSEAMDHPLPPLRRLGLWLHLLICRWCRRYAKQIHFLHEAAHEHPDELAASGPQKLSDEARVRMKRKLQEGQ